jgi:hypothetical protein
MNTLLEPLSAACGTTEEAASYDAWFRVKVQQAIDSKAPRIEHADLVAEMDALIADIAADLAA